MNEARIRLFVGCSPNHEDAESQAVLEWSIRKVTSRPVEITWMQLSKDPGSPFYGWNTRGWATPFSGLRWAIPEICDFKGRAIYCDSDFIFLADVAQLWYQRFKPGKVLIGKGGNAWRICCCLMDCEGMRKYMPWLFELREDPSHHGRLNQFFMRSGLVQPFVGDWNCLDGRSGESLDEIKALHYTDMKTQPQLEYALPRLEAAGRKHWYDGPTRPHPRADVRDLFRSLLLEAHEHGYTVDRYTRHKPFGWVSKRSFANRKVTG